jgi:AAA domain
VADRKRYPVDAAELPRRISLDRARSADAGEWDHVIPDVLPVGATLVYARPKCGKTRIVHQWVHCIAYRNEWAGYAPAETGRCLIIDLENGPHMAMTASDQIAPYYSLEVDRAVTPITRAAEAEAGRDDASMVIIDNQWPGSFFAERLAELDTQLREAKEAGRSYRLVVIDTLKAFTGPPPTPNMNAYDWERTCGQALYDLALGFGIALVMIHHSNKAGEISGSTGIGAATTKVFRLNRAVGEKDGALICEANRAGDERSWKGVFEGGVWTMTDQVTRQFAECTGHQARILQVLAAGPLALEEICTALRDTASKPVIKNALTRAKEKGHIARTSDGRWALTEGTEPPPVDGWGPGTIGEAANPPQIGECAGCHGSMRIIAEGQRTHPDPACEAAAAEAERAAAGPLTEQPELTGRGPAGLADDDGHQDQGDEEARECPDCHDLITGADSHPDCRPGDEAPPKWGEAFTLMRTTLQKSRMRPVAWIPPAGHAAAASVKQNRDMPQWRAAEEADHCAEAGFRWTRPGLLEEFGPDRLVSSFDESQFFPSSCSGVRLAANVLTDHGPLDCNPRLLGDPDPHKQGGGVTGLAGVVRIIAPQWPHSGMPHPMGRRAVPGEPGWWPSGLLEELWKLHEQGLIAPPEVTGSYLGRRSNGLFDTYARGVGEARKAHQADPGMTAAVKRSSSIVLRMLYCQIRSPWWRPDWRAAVVGEGSYRHWVKGWRSSQAGEVIAGMGNVDAVSFLVPQDADPDVYVPTGYEAGREPGTIHPGVIRVRADQCDLSGIDPARIAPSGHPRFAEISGPVPLHVWVMRRA